MPRSRPGLAGLCWEGERGSSVAVCPITGTAAHPEPSRGTGAGMRGRAEDTSLTPHSLTSGAGRYRRSGSGARAAPAPRAGAGPEEAGPLPAHPARSSAPAPPSPRPLPAALPRARRPGAAGPWRAASRRSGPPAPPPPPRSAPSRRRSRTGPPPEPEPAPAEARGPPRPPIPARPRAALFADWSRGLSISQGSAGARCGGVVMATAGRAAVPGAREGPGRGLSRPAGEPGPEGPPEPPFLNPAAPSAAPGAPPLPSSVPLPGLLNVCLAVRGPNWAQALSAGPPEQPLPTLAHGQLLSTSTSGSLSTGII